MHTLRARSIAIALITGCGILAANVAMAQSRADTPPPRLEKLEEGDVPAVTIPGKSSEQQIQETRENGRVTSVRVTSGGSTYYVTPNTPKGSAQPGDVQSTSNRPAQWQIMEFSAERQKDARGEAAAAVPAPPPAPPAPAAR